MIAVEAKLVAPEDAIRPSHLRLYGLISIMVLSWSLNYIIGKIALREFPALLLSGVRTTMAGIFMLPVYYLNRKGREEVVGTSDRWVLIALSLLGVVLNQVLFVLGLSRTSVAHASILAGSSPIIVLVISSFSGQERITARKLAGMAIAVLGVGVLQSAPSNGSGPTLLGDTLILLGSTAFALFTVIGKRFTHAFSTVTVNTYAYVGGALMLLPMTLWQSAGFGFSHVSLAAWMSVLFMAAFPSVICYLIYYYVLKYIPASRASAFSYLQPVIATLVAIPVLGEHVTTLLVGGGALTLTGVYVTERD